MLARDLPRLTDALCKYVEVMYARGTPLARPKEILLALQAEFIFLRGNLAAAWELITSWQAKLLVTMRRPLPDDLLWAMFLNVIANGFEALVMIALKWFGFGVGLLTGFLGLMRPGELTSLCRACVSFGSDGNGKDVASIAVLAPKNWRYMGRHQLVTVDNEYVVRWLKWLSWELPPLCVIFP